MNNDTMKGTWNEMKGNVKTWWGKLTDDDLTQIDGQKDKLIGRLQQRYGYSREQAEREVDSRMGQYHWQHGA